MNNTLPSGRPQLFALAEDMADGLHDHGAAVDIKQNTEPVFRADLDAARTAESVYAAAKSAKDGLATALRIADSNSRAFLKAARAVLAQSLGEAWSAAWDATGFPIASTAVPTSQDERLTLCGRLKNYFTDNPAMEVNTPKLVVSAARADALFTALSAARAAVNNGNTDAGNKKAARDAAEDKLRTRMRGLIAELGQLLGDTDPLWDAFGLNAPGAASTPDAPEALVLTPGGAGTLHADWADARRAARYRVWVQVMGVDADFRAVATVTDSDATLSGLPSGKTVKVRVTAANDAGEGQASEVAEVVVP